MQLHARHHAQRSLITALAGAGVLALLAAGPAAADPGGTRTYRVTIENLTPATVPGGSQVLSPVLAVAHRQGFHLFRPGMAANQAVVDVAEDAVTATGVSMYSGDPDVGMVNAFGNPIPPGQSGSFTFTTSKDDNELSLVTMLVNTNDGFTGLDAVHLTAASRTYEVMAYDAGAEMNDQLKTHIPGPCCGDTGRNGTPEHGMIMPHPGIQAGVGDLSPADWGWPVNMPVARITVERVH